MQEAVRVPLRQVRRLRPVHDVVRHRRDALGEVGRGADGAEGMQTHAAVRIRESGAIGGHPSGEERGDARRASGGREDGEGGEDGAVMPGRPSSVCSSVISSAARDLAGGAGPAIPGQVASLALGMTVRTVRPVLSVFSMLSPSSPSSRPPAAPPARTRRAAHPPPAPAAAAGSAPERIMRVSDSASPAAIGSPRPPAPMNAASVAVPTLMTAAVRMPAMMSGAASGSRTWRRICARRHAQRAGRADRVGRGVADAGVGVAQDRDRASRGTARPAPAPRRCRAAGS